MDKLIPVLEKLAEKLGVAANHIYGVLIRQSIIDAWVSFAILAIFTIASAVAGIKLSRYLKREDENLDDHPAMASLVGTLIGITVIVFIYFLCAFPQIFNPEAGALSTIFRAIGN